MIARSTFSLTLLLLTLMIPGAYAERMLSGKIGMTWPRELLSTGIPTGDAELNYGIIIDKKVALGISGNFLWNVKAKKQQLDSSEHYKIIDAQQSYMFPIMGFFQIDPVPNLIVHPVATFKIGYNSLIYSYTEADSSNRSSKPLYPYFYGLIIKGEVEALYDIGERSSLFLGMGYRWANAKTFTKSGLFDERNMGGIALSAGFRVLL
jgi:hypothetical protein